jgi:transcriptional regulator with XRE-family HTH domain
MVMVSEDLHAFCKEVRRRREALGLTLDELAKRSGLTPNYIGTIENELRDPSLSTARNLAKGLGVSLGELFSWTDRSAAAVECGQLLDACPSELRDVVLFVLRYFSRKLRQPGPV